jgi:hypothetical protein
MDETKKPEDIGKAVESVELPSLELPEAELAQVVGGTDKASPTLATACAKGKHFDKVTL